MRAFAVEFKADSSLYWHAMNVEAFQERLGEAAEGAGFQLGSYGVVGDISLPVLERDGNDGQPRVYIGAGVHGNEPAGPMAVLDMLRRKSLPEGFHYLVFPMVNPTGLIAGTRENHEGIDLNRDYGLEPRSMETQAQLAFIGDRQFDLVLCLHEDDDGTGFYLYSHVEQGCPHDYPGLAIEAARPWTGIDWRTEIDEMPARDGRMFPPEDVMDIGRPDLPEALRLHFHHGARYTFTTETPSTQPIDRRIRAQCAVVETILETYRSAS